MSSLKDRIAMFNKKPEEKAVPAASSSSNSMNNDRTPQKSTAPSSSSSSSSFSSTTVSSSSSVSVVDAAAADPSPVRRQSIAQRIGQLRTSSPAPAPAAVVQQKASSELQDSLSEDVNNNVITTTATTTATTTTTTTTSSDLGDSLLKVVEPAQVEPLNSVVESPSAPKVMTRRLSVSDRIASLKNIDFPSSPEGTDTVETKADQPRKTLIADRIAAMKNTPIHKPSEVDKYLSPTKSFTESLEPHAPPALPARVQAEPSIDPLADLPPPPTKSSTIADRIAAMKTSSIKSEAPAEPQNTNEPRKLSNNLKDLGAKILLPGLGPRPMLPVKPPKPVPHTDDNQEQPATPTVATIGKKTNSSVDENGEFQHLNLSRVSVPRKRTPSTRMRKNWQDSDDLHSTTSSFPSLESITDKPEEDS